MVETGWLAPVCVTAEREREPYMHMEEPLYRQPAGASVCVIIENIGREKTLREKRERNVYTTYTYKNIYDLVSSQGEEEKHN